MSVPQKVNPYLSPDIWGREVATRWLAFEATLDRALAPFGDAALALARPGPGDRVIDVGCGTGSTTAALAVAVGPAGKVLGVDVSPLLLARARERTAWRPQIDFRQDDAQTTRFDGGHQLVYSRFGVMFFADPAAAFANLASALGPGGRMTFVCWRRFEENPWQHLAFSAVRAVIPDAAAPPEDGPGPHGLADPAKIERLMAGAGLTGVTIQPIDRRVSLGPDLATAVSFAMNSGPAGRAMAATDQQGRQRARVRITEALAGHLGDDGVCLGAAAWLVDARAGG